MERVDRFMEALKTYPHYDDAFFVYLFGSHATNTANAFSDIDICIAYDLPQEKKQELYFYIQGENEDLDISLFSMLPLHIQAEVFKGTLLYTKDKNRLIDTVQDVSMRHSLFEPQRTMIIEGHFDV